MSPGGVRPANRANVCDIVFSEKKKKYNSDALYELRMIVDKHLIVVKSLILTLFRIIPVFTYKPCVFG